MKPFLMGTETEYGLSGRDGDQPLPPEQIYGLLLDAVRRERLWLPDAVGGASIYLENGARLYMDSGAHPEYATPEVFTPAQVAAHDKAGERLLELARERLQRERPSLQVSVLKCNVSPICPDKVTWGCHESYTCWVPAERAAKQLIPHLVSRTIFAGAGCLSAHSRGVGFELSQRARHIVQATGTDTTSNRPIFGTRVRKATDSSKDGWVRVHLICKDAQRAPLGIYLTFGTTGLLFLIVNLKRKVGQGLELADPVRALHAIARDPWLRVRVPLADGRKLTAVQIQESYLEECEREVQQGGFPDWAPEVLRHWRETLHDLQKDPLRLAGRLDPYTKLLIFDHELRRAGISWGDLHGAQTTLARLRDKFPTPVIRALLAEAPQALPVDQQTLYANAATAAGVERAGVADRLRFAVRLQALEFHYHELGGLYDQLAAAGRMQDVVLTHADIETATHEAPPGGRAALRAACVRRYREPGWICDWRYVYNSESQTYVDLRDPFVTRHETRRVEELPEDDQPDDDLLDILTRVLRR